MKIQAAVREYLVEIEIRKERKINAYLKKLKAFGWEAHVVAV